IPDRDKYISPEGVPRLFDLIHVEDDRVKPAFYYALRDTLVANDLEQATRIAFGRIRTMTGGGKTVSRGRMGQSVAVTSTDATPKKLNSMEQRLKEVESHARQLCTQQVSLENKVDLLTQKLQTMRKDLNVFNMEIKLPSLEKQLKQQEERLKAAAPDPVQVKKLESCVNKTKKLYDKAAEEAGKVEAEVQKLHSKIMGITGGRMKAAQKKVDEVTNNLDKVRKEITKLKVAIKTAERNSKKCSEKITNMDQEVEECENKMRAMQSEIETIEVEGKKNVDDLKIVSNTVVTKEQDLETLKEELAEILKGENKLKGKKLDIDQKIENINKEITDSRQKIPSLTRELSSLKIREIPGEEIPELKKLSVEEVEKIDNKDLQYKVSVLEAKLKNEKPNIGAIKEYQQKELQYLQRVGELEKSTERRNEMRKHHEMVRKNRYNEFMKGFCTISSKLKEMYQMITLGGDAELELVDSLDPFSEGINFSVRPPKKTWKMISNLSGGEKTLSSLALVFALHYYKPTPLYVMDEIDAALDFKNVSIVGHYIKERTKNAQFIIISLRSNMFELADRLVGIYKTYNCTHSVTLNPKLYGTTGAPAMSSQSATQPKSARSLRICNASYPVTATNIENKKHNLITIPTFAANYAEQEYGENLNNKINECLGAESDNSPEKVKEYLKMDYENQ
ncbi:hypothetical protein L9F63_002008, partial [Diploptera punctata]